MHICHFLAPFQRLLRYEICSRKSCCLKFARTIHTAIAAVVSDFVTAWTAAYQAPLTLGFSRQEYLSGLPCPPPGDLPNPGIEPGSPALRVDSLPSEPSGKPKNVGVGGYPFSRESSQPKNRTGVSSTAGGFFTN